MDELNESIVNFEEVANLEESLIDFRKAIVDWQEKEDLEESVNSPDGLSVKIIDILTKAKLYNQPEEILTCSVSVLMSHGATLEDIDQIYRYYTKNEFTEIKSGWLSTLCFDLFNFL